MNAFSSLPSKTLILVSHLSFHINSKGNLRHGSEQIKKIKNIKGCVWKLRPENGTEANCQPTDQLGQEKNIVVYVEIHRAGGLWEKS